MVQETCPSFLVWRVLGICSQTLPFSHTDLYLADELQINVVCINSSKALTLARCHISEPENGLIPILSQPSGLLSAMRAPPNPSLQAPHSTPHLLLNSGQVPSILPTESSVGSGPAEQRGCILSPPLLPSSLPCFWPLCPPRLLYHENIGKESQS